MVNLIVTFSAIIISILYGLSVISGAILTEKIPGPIVMLGTAFINISLVFTYYFLSSHSISNINFTPYIIKWFFINAVLCVFLPNFLFYNIINKNNTVLVSILCSTYPIWTLILSYIFLKKQNSNIMNIGMGVIITIIGVSVVIANSK
jgi:drug/metabolite transporter (DMT)-like permease